MKSKTIKWNAFMLLTAIVTYATQYSSGIWHIVLPSKLLIILVAVAVVGSEIINYFFPSGKFVGSGLDWSIPKWIFQLATIALAFLQDADIVKIIPTEYLIFVIPILQMVARVFGGATPLQVKAANQ